MHSIPWTDARLLMVAVGSLTARLPGSGEKLASPRCQIRPTESTNSLTTLLRCTTPRLRAQIGKGERLPRAAGHGPHG